MSTLVVIEPGVATTVQDRGRPGFAHLGVSPSGAVDPALAGLANRLVGNADGAAVIETCGGLELLARGAVTVASTVEATARSVADGERISVPAGHGRFWHYLAVRGGIVVDPVLGSRATDTLSGLGPPPLQVGDAVPIGREPVSPIETTHAPLRSLAGAARIGLGPRVDWFRPTIVERFAAEPWTVTVTSRVGVRLGGFVVERIRTGELASEGLVRGAIQVPPDGNPVMMLADHPTTGGYPVVAVVHPDDVAIVAQTSPGGTVRFRPGRRVVPFDAGERSG
jgi:biotin-dependent carboxylase-like uncharacterized protein